MVSSVARKPRSWQKLILRRALRPRIVTSIVVLPRQVAARESRRAGDYDVTHSDADPTDDGTERTRHPEDGRDGERAQGQSHARQVRVPRAQPLDLGRREPLDDQG